MTWPIAKAGLGQAPGAGLGKGSAQLGGGLLPFGKGIAPLAKGVPRLGKGVSPFAAGSLGSSPIGTASLGKGIFERPAILVGRFEPAHFQAWSKGWADELIGWLHVPLGIRLPLFARGHLWQHDWTFWLRDQWVIVIGRWTLHPLPGVLVDAMWPLLTAFSQSPDWTQKTMSHSYGQQGQLLPLILLLLAMKDDKPKPCPDPIPYCSGEPRGSYNGAFGGSWTRPAEDRRPGSGSGWYRQCPHCGGWVWCELPCPWPPEPFCEKDEREHRHHHDHQHRHHHYPWRRHRRRKKHRRRRWGGA